MTATKAKSKPNKKGGSAMATKSTAKKPSTKGGKVTKTSLASYIPEKHFLDDYVSRDINGINDLEVLETAHSIHTNVLLYGPTGSAKTSLVYAYGAKVGLPVINVPCNGSADVRSLLGGWTPTPDGGFEFSAGPLVKGIQEGAIIYLDEVNFMPPKISACLHGLLDKRRTIDIPDAAGSSHPTEVKAHPDTFIIGAMNPNYAGTRPLNEAFRNRFAIKIEWGYDSDVEAQLIGSASLLDMAEKIRARAETGEISPIPTNVLIEFEDLVDTFSEQFGAEAGFNFALNNLLSTYSDEVERAILEEAFDLCKESIISDLGLKVSDVITD